MQIRSSPCFKKWEDEEDLKKKIIYFCSHKFSIFAFISNKEGDDLRDYIQENFSRECRDAILNEYISNFYEERSPRRYPHRVMELFLTEDTKSLKVLNFDSFDHDNIIRLIKKYTPNLTYLEYHCNLLTQYDLKNLLTRMSNLKVLKISSRELNNYDFIKIILENCPILEQLEFNYLGFKTVLLTMPLNIVEAWPKHNYLKEFRIIMRNDQYFMNGSWNSIVKILEKFPKLNILDMYSDLGLAILELSPKMPLFLTEITDRYTSLETITKIHNYFPNLRSINLLFPNRGVVNFLSNFITLEKIHLEDIKSSEFNDLILKYGFKFKSLILELFDILNLTLTLERCPNLLFLDIRNTSHMLIDKRNFFHNKLKYFHISNDSNDLLWILQGLITIETIHVKSQFDFLSFSNFPKLLSAWQNLKILSLPNTNFFCHDYIYKIIKSCDHLELIYFPIDIKDDESVLELRKFIKENCLHIRIKHFEKFNERSHFELRYNLL